MRKGGDINSVRKGIRVAVGGRRNEQYGKGIHVPV
jgi:hypothetical protein